MSRIMSPARKSLYATSKIPAILLFCCQFGLNRTWSDQLERLTLTTLRSIEGTLRSDFSTKRSTLFEFAARGRLDPVFEVDRIINYSLKLHLDVKKTTIFL